MSYNFYSDEVSRWSNKLDQDRDLLISIFKKSQLWVNLINQGYFLIREFIVDNLDEFPDYYKDNSLLLLLAYCTLNKEYTGEEGEYPIYDVKNYTDLKKIININSNLSSHVYLEDLLQYHIKLYNKRMYFF